MNLSVGFLVSRLTILFSAAFLLFTSQLATAGDYDDNEELKAIIDELVAEELYTREELTNIFSSAERKQSILDAISRPAEKTKTWKEYKQIFLAGNKRAKAGLKFWKEHQQTLQRAEDKYGVPAEMIVAIIGVETYYGRHKGKFRVIDSLSTLAFDYPPRSSFFRKQLVAFLRLCKEANIDPNTMTGSYAGAMGYPQFIPTSYQAYAVDFDGDGSVDLANSIEDAIGSVASYFRAHKWRTGKEVAGRASIANQDYDDIVNKSKKPKLSIADIQAKGLNPILCSDAQVTRFCLNDIQDQDKAMPLKFFGEHGAEFWIALDNFYVITRYNHSNLYGMAAFQLSRELKDLRDADLANAK